MREIKFRAWDKERGMFLNGVDLNHIAEYCRDEDFDFLNIMQYTGLKDKNGKEIYEGDIVKLGDNVIHDGVLVECQFSQSRAMWVYVFLTGENKDKATDMVDSFRSYEVIGNIYEHGDLLK